VSGRRPDSHLDFGLQIVMNEASISSGMKQKKAQGALL